MMYFFCMLPSVYERTTNKSFSSNFYSLVLCCTITPLFNVRGIVVRSKTCLTPPYVDNYVSVPSQDPVPGVQRLSLCNVCHLFFVVVSVLLYTRPLTLEFSIELFHIFHVGTFHSLLYSIYVSPFLKAVQLPINADFHFI